MTDAERWITYHAAAVARSPETSPKDAAAIADHCEEEFQLRWSKDRGAGWVRKSNTTTPRSTR